MEKKCRTSSVFLKRLLLTIGAWAVAGGVVLAVLITSGCAVTRNTNPYISDQVISSTIKARHAQNENLVLTDISVETLYGVVLLSGFAHSPQDKITAQNIAERVDGVKAVHNEILIQTDHTIQNTAPSDQTKPVFDI